MTNSFFYLGDIKYIKNVVAEGAYLYSIARDEFRVYDGRVLLANDGKYYFEKASAAFQWAYTWIPKKQGEFWKNTVWYENRCDMDAATIFTDYINDKLEELNNKLKRYNKIQHQLDTGKATKNKYLI